MRRNFGFLVLDILEQVKLTSPIEGEFSRHQLIQDNAEGPDITLRSVSHFEDLGRNVVRRARNLLLALHLCG